MAITLRSASTAMRSQMAYSVSRSWVIRNTVRPRACCRVRIRRSKAAAPIGSSPAVGSSRNSSGGSSANARASPARLRMPPDNCEGSLSSASAGKPASLIFSSASSKYQRSGNSPWCSFNGTCTFSPTVIDENSAPSWNSTPVLRVMCWRSANRPERASAPSTWMLPASGSRRPRMLRINTDLPVPEPPTTPRISPRRTSRSRSSCTVWRPNRLVSPRTEIAN